MTSQPKPRCPGCSRPLAAGRPWCPPCEQRMPADLSKAVRHADRALRAAVAAGTVWLQQHPHATSRELDVLALAAQGRANEEIAAELHISLNTVRSCWKDLSKRWGCRGRAHAVATAFQLGYLGLTRKDTAA